VSRDFGFRKGEQMTGAIDEPTEPNTFDSGVEAIAALNDPIRRDLYRLVVASAEPISRDDAAAGVSTSRAVAAFHLDRLVEAGLLETEFRRLSGRRGPGAGRPNKLYRRSARTVSVSLPERRHDLAARLLAQAISQTVSEGTPVEESLREAAAECGRLLGAESRRAAGLAGESAGGSTVVRVLAEHGFEPQIAEGTATLRNCPFSKVAKEYPQVVCRMNLDLIRGLLRGMGSSGVTARLDPGPGRCCVRLSFA
jgi:predicted ArsR family transcriptional regulator